MYLILMTNLVVSAFVPSKPLRGGGETCSFNRVILMFMVYQTHLYSSRSGKIKQTSF